MLAHRHLFIICSSFIGVALVGASSSTVSAVGASQGSVQKAVVVPALTNQDVIDLVKSGFGEDLIIAQVQTAKSKLFDLTTKGLIALKGAGVSDRVLTVMMGSPDPGKAVPPAAPTSAAPSLNAPAAPSANAHEAGIYLQEEDGRLTQLEPAVFSGGKTGGMLTSALTYGIKKAKWKAVVRSPRANQRVYTALPVFYFYFEKNTSGLSNTSVLFGASSPNEFVLARMSSDKNERQLIVGEMGALGSSTGTRSEDTISMKVEKIQSGVYKVTLESPLTEGEYCFFYAAGASSFMAAGSGKLFDFGVQRK